jgi:hypothetical protein
MSQHPAGVFNPAAPFRQGPPAPLYFSELTKPTRGLCFMVEMDLDQVATVTQRIRTFAGGPTFHPLYRAAVTSTVLTPDTRRYATAPLITAPDDEPAVSPIQGLLSPVRLERALETEAGGLFAPVAQSSIGIVALRNDDGALDGLETDQAVIGRELVLSAAPIADGVVLGPTIFDVLANEAGAILVSDRNARLTTGAGGSTSVMSAFSPIWRGVSDAVSWDRSRAQITARDFRVKLQRPVQRATYSGGGGFDGTAELAGLTRPMAFGRCRNVRPALIDPARLIYQFHAGEARSVDVVRDSGVPLAFFRRVESYAELVALEPPSADSDGDFPLGSWVSCPRAGCFRLAGAPAGVVTADVRGAGGADSLRETFSDGTLFSDGTGWRNASLKVYSRTAAAIIARLLLDQAELTDAEVSISQIAQKAVELPYEAGLYLEPGGQRTIAECVELLARSLGCVLIRAKDGRYQLRDLAPPREAAVLTIGPDQILEGTLQRAPPAYRQPPADLDITYDRNWSPLSESEIAGAVEVAARAALTLAEPVLRVTDNSLATIYPDRGAVRIETALTRSADAADLGRRQHAFYSFGRSEYGVTVKGASYRAELLDTVRLASPRFGLAQGRSMVVTSIGEDGVTGQTVLGLFG